MTGSIRIGSILDFEIRIHYSWLFIFLLITWSLSAGLFPQMNFGPWLSIGLGVAGALLLFASVVAHEISHSLVARRFGTEVSGITLFLFGGVAQLKSEPQSPKAEFFTAVVGPITSFAIGLACLAFAGLAHGGDPLDPSAVLLALGGLAREGVAISPLAALLGYLGWINVLLAFFNLIPGFPLDGGRILRSALWHFTGDLRRATRWASYTGRAFAWLLIGWGFFQLMSTGNLGSLWLVFIGWFLNNAAEAAYQQLLLRRALRGVSVGEVMSQEIPAVDADLPVAELVDRYMLRYDFTAYPVAREGRFAGVVTLEDVRGLDRDRWPTTPAGSLAHPPAEERTVRVDQDAWDALTQMLENDAPRLLVMDDGRLDGIVSRDAIIRLVQRKLRLGFNV